MSSATLRSDRESASWTNSSADFALHYNYDAHDSDSDSEDSTDNDSSSDEHEVSQSEDIEEDEADNDDPDDKVSASDTLSEFEAALISQLEENEDEDNDEPILPNAQITGELIGFSGIDNKDSDDEDMEDVMATMSPLDSGASTTVASSPASTLVASTPASPSTTEPKTDFPGVQPVVEPSVGSKRRRSIVDADNEEETPAYKNMRLSSVEQEKSNEVKYGQKPVSTLSRHEQSCSRTDGPTVGVLTQGDNPTTQSQASVTFEEAVKNSGPHSIPVINNGSNAVTNMPVSWPGLPRPKHCVKLKSYGGTVAGRSQQTLPTLNVPAQQPPPSFYYPYFPIQNVASLPIHAQMEVPSTSTHPPLCSLSPPQPPIGPYQGAALPNYYGLTDSPPNQFLTQPVFPYFDMPQNMTVDPSTLFLAGYNMNLEMPMPLANAFTANIGTQGYHDTPPAVSAAPQSLPAQMSYIQAYEGMGTIPHQLQQPYGSSSSGTVATTETSPIPNPVVCSSPGIVATSTSPASTNPTISSLSPPTFTRLPQTNFICHWDLGGGHLCEQTVVGEAQARRHISDHTSIYRGDKSWTEWENTSLQCQWKCCSASLKAGSLKKHIMRQHFCMTYLRCDRCGHVYGCNDTFKVHLLKDGRCRGLKPVKT